MTIRAVFVESDRELIFIVVPGTRPGKRRL
jgi:hypothetical protein